MTVIRKSRIWSFFPEALLILLCFGFCLAGAILLPVSVCPDEPGRRAVSDWIFSHGSLPTGNERETIMAFWGFSYALRPYLSGIIAAFFMKIVSLISGAPVPMIVASRLGSVFAVTLCCFGCLRLGRRLFRKRGSAIFFATAVCFTPQVMFLGMYQNNDSLALVAVCMILNCFDECVENGWKIKSCIHLAVWLSVGLLSYYNTYGWILMCALFFLIAVIRDRRIQRQGRLILQRGSLMIGICLILAGWFFIRNAIIHNGDFLGISSTFTLRNDPEYLKWLESMNGSLYQFVNYRQAGMSVAEFLQFKNWEWVRMTWQSIIGVFGGMDLYMPLERYGIYGTLIVLGLFLFGGAVLHCRPEPRARLLIRMMLFSSVITLLLHFWYSYGFDYQPQGRYIITVLLPVFFLIAWAFDKTDLHFRETDRKLRWFPAPAVIAAFVWVGLFILTFSDTMLRMIPGVY